MADESAAAVIKTGASAQAADKRPGLAQAQLLWQKATLAQRMLIAGLLVLVASTLVFIASSGNSKSGYKVLFANLSDGDGAAIIAALDQMNVPHQFTEGGAAILVPQESVYDTRLKLAGQGLPRGGNVGFELLDQQKFGASQFLEQVNYLRGLEGELGRTVSSMGQIKTARVHLAVPKATAFVRERPPPTASVVVTLYPGRSLGPNQLAAIARLVSSSVPGMKAQDVSIADTEGGVLSADKSRLDGINTEQLEYTRELESALTRRVSQLLEPLTGEGGFRAQVTVDLNFDEFERTSEVYGKNGTREQQAIRSEQSVNGSAETAGARGVPGALSNQPQDPPEAPIVNSMAGGGPGDVLMAPGNVETGISVLNNGEAPRTERMVNYEVDRAIERLKAGRGKITRVSAAVVLDHKPATQLGQGKVAFTEQELAQVEALVKDAVGFVANRGDTVSVVNLAFSEEPIVEPNFFTPDLAADLVRYAAIALAAILVYFAVLRPLIKPAKVAPPPPPPPTPSAAERFRAELAAKEEAWTLQQEALQAERRRQEAEARLAREEQQSRDAALHSSELAAKAQYDELVSYAQKFASDNTQETTNLLRAWLSGSSGVGAAPQAQEGQA